MRVLHPSRTLAALAALAGLAVAALLVAAPARAGCGCDHPPPAWSPVMPPFGSPGKTVTIWANDFSLRVGERYKIDFGSADVTVEATRTDRIAAAVPATVPPGPVAIKLRGPGVDRVYSDTLFTALPPARRIDERTGMFGAVAYEAAVGADGTLFLALDVSQVLDPMQFAFALHELPLHFSNDDVVIYNADGVDLTLFTLDVEDPNQHQWGSYYGWTVESDAGLPNTYYDPQTDDSFEVAKTSDVFTYWRHEFHTYAQAHEPGGSHEVDVAGFHPDGTAHVDHDSLVIAIHGIERDTSSPNDLSKAEPLSPGKRQVNVGWLSVVTDHPLELGALIGFIPTHGSVWAMEQLEESWGDSDDD